MSGRKVTALLCAAVLGVGVMSAVDAGAALAKAEGVHAGHAAKVNASGYGVTCTGQSGSTTFSPALKIPGTMSGKVKVKVSATLTHCTAQVPTGGAPLTITKGVVSGTLQGTKGTSCLQSIENGGSLPLSGSLKVKWTTSPKISSGVTRVGVTSGAIGFTGTAVDPGNDENTLTFPGNTPGTVLGSFSAHPSESFSYSVTNKTIATFLTQCESAAGLSSVTDLGGLADFGVPATSITVTQNPSGVSSIPIGNSPIYTATADLPGNPALDITPEATFSSLNPGVATFGGGLQVFGASLNLVGPGTTMISASFGGVTSNSVSLTVLSALQIVTTSLPDGQVGVPYDQFVTASGGLAPYSWSQGSLPTGLDINPATGEITGTPTTTGDYADAFVDVGDSYTPGNDLASQYIPIIIDP